MVDWLFQKKERDDYFGIELGECDGGATLGKITNTIVTIVKDEGKSMAPLNYQTIACCERCHVQTLVLLHFQSLQKMLIC